MVPIASSTAGRLLPASASTSAWLTTGFRSTFGSLARAPAAKAELTIERGRHRVHRHDDHDEVQAAAQIQPRRKWSPTIPAAIPPIKSRRRSM